MKKLFPNPLSKNISFRDAFRSDELPRVPQVPRAPKPIRKSILRITLSLAAVSAVLVFSGCQNRGAYLPKNTNKYNYEDTEPLVLMDRMVQRSITSPGVQRNPLPDGRLEVVVNLRNQEARRIQVQAQCVFKDGQGFPVDETPWVNVFLTENAQEGVKFTSMNDKAQRFTIRVRQAH